MTTRYHSIIQLENNTGLPEDRCMFNFYWQDGLDRSPAVAGGQVADFMIDFMNGLNAGGSPIGAYISPEISREADSARAIVIARSDWNPATPEGSEVADVGFTLAAPGGATPLPTEVAVVLTVHGTLTGIPEEQGVTRPRARRRGRIYVGPLITNVVQESATGGHPLVLDTMRTSLGTAARRMQLDAEATDWSWVVWSRVGQSVDHIIGGWVDNAFDTQRRRGPDATERTLWTTS